MQKKPVDDLGEYESYLSRLEKIKKRKPRSQEPMNGGATIADFFSVIAEVDNSFVPTIAFQAVAVEE